MVLYLHALFLFLFLLRTSYTCEYNLITHYDQQHKSLYSPETH